ncbi:MAG: redox-sensing transcriptional repressor Rex [Sedimentisphaerales bacterium]|nr:redox-sensing transcriptional repressor Rex [Sedimentisphaerales bacterium]
MRYHKIPDETVRRLPLYLRGLLFSSQDLQENISSRKLAEVLGVNPWQIRKDFSYFGGFGTPGVGYNVEKLTKQIKKILKLDIGHRATLVGVGNLGAAILAYPGFKIYGFDIAAVFDNNSKKIGQKIGDVTIEDVAKLPMLKGRQIDLGIIAVPRGSAQEIANILVDVGIKGILNFSPCRIDVSKKVKVITIDIAMDLARLPYYMPSS